MNEEEWKRRNRLWKMLDTRRDGPTFDAEENDRAWAGFVEVTQ